jgi:hypothetical protein
VILKPTKGLFGIDAIEFRIKGNVLSKKLLESTYDVIFSVIGILWFGLGPLLKYGIEDCKISLLI